MSDKTRNSVMLAATENYIEKINNFAKEVQIEFSPYQQSCVVNAVRTINPMLVKNGYNWNTFPVDNIITVLQQAAFLELNPSATPNECYYIIRKEKGENNQWNPILEFGIEGAGNDRILRKFGQDVADLKSYIVYEGDEFVEGYMDGWDMTLPKYKRLFKTNKPIKVVYLIKKNNGEIDVQYADTQDVMKSLLANAKQNLMNSKGVDENKLLRELSKLDLYDILESDKWLDYTIKKSGYNNKDYDAPLFNPSYTSPISMYNMIERKLRNHATRKYPKNFNHKEVSVLYEETFDEKYNTKGELETAEERVQIANDEIEEKQSSVPLKKVDHDDRPTLNVEEEITDEKITIGVTEEKETEATEYEPYVEEPKEEEKEVAVEEKKQSSFEDDLPDWAK